MSLGQVTSYFTVVIFVQEKSRQQHHRDEHGIIHFLHEVPSDDVANRLSPPGDDVINFVGQCDDVINNLSPSGDVADFVGQSDDVINNPSSSGDVTVFVGSSDDAMPGNDT